jgi:hypothetical protein
MASKAQAERVAYQPSVLMDPAAWAVATVYGVAKPHVTTAGYEFLYVFAAQDMQVLRTRREGDTIVIDSLQQYPEAPRSPFVERVVGATSRVLDVYSTGNHLAHIEVMHGRGTAVTISGETPNPHAGLRYGKP